MSVAIVTDSIKAIRLLPGLSAGGTVPFTLRFDIDDDGQWRRIEHGIRKGETRTFEWSENRRVPFQKHVKITLTQEDAGLNYTVGEVVVKAADVNRGPLRHNFTDNGAHFELAYRVIPADVDID